MALSRFDVPGLPVETRKIVVHRAVAKVNLHRLSVDRDGVLDLLERDQNRPQVSAGFDAPRLDEISLAEVVLGLVGPPRPQSDSQVGTAGNSSLLPSGRPASIHCSTVAISLSGIPRSPSNVAIPGVGGQGGIYRRLRTSEISSARVATSP